jgi:hypothetical protein
MAIPADSLFAIRTKVKQQAEEEERSELKKIVLEYDQRERTSGVEREPLVPLGQRTKNPHN